MDDSSIDPGHEESIDMNSGEFGIDECVGDSDGYRQASVAVLDTHKHAASGDLATSRLISNMGVEMRTPMNAIIGFSEVLAEGDLSEEQRHHVEIIHDSAKRLLKLMSDILDYSMIEADGLEVETGDCSMERLFAVVESAVRPRAMAKGLDFEFIHRGNLPSRIRTDAERVRQCLVNLIDNGIKFTEAGYVTVTVSQEDIDGEAYMRFDVEDTGIGITPRMQELIFDGYWREQTNSGARCHSVGLGLLLTRKLARLLGGDVTVKSELGAGSLFSFIIPANVDVKLQSAIEGTEPLNSPGRQPDDSDETKSDRLCGRILVAEDSKSNQTLVRLILEQLGLDVTMVEDGKEAVKMASEREFDVIFMDIQMPNMNGFEATRLLRANDVAAPIVALTAHAMKGDAQKCIAAGCSDYITKPIDRTILLEVLGKHLSADDG